MSKIINCYVNCNHVTLHAYSLGVKKLPTVMVTQLQLHTKKKPVNKGTYKGSECNLIDNYQRTPK